jgi:hypothetical protein
MYLRMTLFMEKFGMQVVQEIGAEYERKQNS